MALNTSENPATCDLITCCQLRNLSDHPLDSRPLISERFLPFPTTPHAELAHYYHNYNSDVHDLNLTNLLIWAQRHDLHYFVVNHYIIYVYYPRDSEHVYFSEPVGDTSQSDQLLETLKQIVQWCTSESIPMRFRRISNRCRDLLLTLRPDAAVEPIPDAYDYCYLTSDLANLSGNRYHKKKNHLNQFQKKHEGRYQIHAINSENAKDALQVATNWCKENGCRGDYDLCYEYRGIAYLLNRWPHFSSFKIEGVVVYVDDQPVAFSLAEPWTNDTLLVHIEKGDTNYPGIYAAVNNAMAKQAMDRFKYLNREQDMGIEGIRKAKLSYLPSHLIEKSNLTL